MNNSITIRRATHTDNALLAEIGAQTFYDTFAPDNTPENIRAYIASAFSPDIQARELTDARFVFLIAEVNDHAVGYAQIRLKDAPPCITGARPIELGRLYTRQEWIGRGVGAALMRASLDFAAQENADTIWLDVWERNPRAIAFYRAWGFVEVGTQIFQMGDDPQTDLLMQRPIKF